MPRRSQVAPPQTACGNVMRRSAKPNVFKSLDWKKELDRVLKKKAVRIPAAMTRQEIRRRFGDEADCEVLTPETFSLKCPISNKRIQVAAKGVNCALVQCFDLSAYIQVRVCSNRWYCPLCEAETKLDQLRINEFVNAVLHATDTSVERVELVGDGSYRPVVQVEIHADVKINDELPYVLALEDIKPNGAEGGQALSEAMDVEQATEPLDSLVTTASSEREEDSVLEDVKPILAPQPANSDAHGATTPDEAHDVKPVIAPRATNSTLGAREQSSNLEEDGNLKLQLEASNAEVQRVLQELRTEQATRLDLERKASQLRKYSDDAKARFDELQQKRVQEDHENAAQLKALLENMTQEIDKTNAQNRELSGQLRESDRMAWKLRKLLIKHHGETLREDDAASDDGEPEGVENTPLEKILLDEIDALQDKVAALTLERDDAKKEHEATSFPFYYSAIMRK